jgi:hypothetical protein
VFRAGGVARRACRYGAGWGSRTEVAVRGADPQEKERESLAEKQRIGANINIKKRAHLLGHRS